MSGYGYCIVTAPRAFMYEKPDGFAIADEMLAGWAAGVTGETADRLKVLTHYGYEGWIGRETARQATLQEIEERDRQGQLCILTGMFTDLQTAPTVHGEITGTYGRGSLVTRTAERDDGYSEIVAADGSRGYMPSVAMKKRTDSDCYLESGCDSSVFDRIAGQRTDSLGIERLRGLITSAAERYLGTQYRWGGKGADGIDCSGLAFMSYMLSGVLIYRDASIEAGYPVHEIPRDRLEPADLIFFRGHVAVYLGNGRYIHSTGYRESCGCVINSLLSDSPDYRQDLAEGILHTGSIF